MRENTVIAADGREWRVRCTVEWREYPSWYDDVEHDVDGGPAGPLLLGAALVVFWVLLLVWLPDGVHVPWWVWGYLLLAAVLAPLRWFRRRPRTIVAETQGSYDLPPEYWTGMVRGARRAREEIRVIERSLRTRATPGHADSPLQPVD